MTGEMSDTWQWNTCKIFVGPCPNRWSINLQELNVFYRGLNWSIQDENIHTIKFSNLVQNCQIQRLRYTYILTYEICKHFSELWYHRVFRVVFYYHWYSLTCKDRRKFMQYLNALLLSSILCLYCDWQPMKRFIESFDFLPSFITISRNACRFSSVAITAKSPPKLWHSSLAISQVRSVKKWKL